MVKEKGCRFHAVYHPVIARDVFLPRKSIVHCPSPGARGLGVRTFTNRAMIAIRNTIYPLK
jgi:hypothetical protein